MTRPARIAPSAVPGQEETLQCSRVLRRPEPGGRQHRQRRSAELPRFASYEAGDSEPPQGPEYGRAGPPRTLAQLAERGAVRKLVESAEDDDDRRNILHPFPSRHPSTV